MKESVKVLLKKTVFYSLFFRYMHFRYYTYPGLKNKYGTKLRLSKERYYNRYVYQYFPRKPVVVNLNANDICNSKCTMCNIWQQKQEHEVTPEELKKILSNSLYSEVAHIGITGGEPTLREDLPLLYKAAIEAIPNLKGLSIITNAIRQKDVIERVEKVMEVCKQHKKTFSMMVSVDGYGETHDRIRGREGNFETAMAVINHFKDKGVGLTIGSTISKGNVWDAEDLLYFLKKTGIYGRFRVAEFIKRLYNDDRSEVIRNFTDEEKYQLTLFFYKLIYTFEKEETYKRTYLSIIDVLNGRPRRIGCPYQSEGVVLNSRGELAYCAPKSPIIGSALNADAESIYKDKLQVRREILEKDCDNCIHDYHYRLTEREDKLQEEDAKWRAAIHVKNNKTLSFSGNEPEYLKSKKVKAFIVGWYGTETVGDKAILAGIADQLKVQYGDNLQIAVASLFPYITHKTVIELDLDAIVVPVYSQDFVANAQYSDISIMGGGPLMDLEELAVPLHCFRTAKKYKRKTIVFGCGLGPLHEEKYRNAVKEILSLTDDIRLRDNGSIRLANTFGFDKITLSGDPARYYLQKKFLGQSNSQPPQNILACFLREWTHEYSRDLDEKAFQEQKEAFEMGIAQLIRKKAGEFQVEEVQLHNMHNFVIGNDDRDFSRYFIEKYFNKPGDVKIMYDRKLSTVDSVVATMLSARHNLCMRFHSVLFAETLDVSFTAIDYTKGGKILNYLKDNNKSEHLVSVEDLTLLSVND